MLCVRAQEPSVREVGALVFDGVPEIQPRIHEAARPYAQIRSASLFSWSSDGESLLIGTRFGETTQVHRISASIPDSDRYQLTFFNEPVGGATSDPKRNDGFYFSRDTGGGEFYQYYWFDLATGQATLLSDGVSRNEGLIVAHAGGKFAYASTRRNGADFDIYVQDGLTPASAKMVAERKGQWNPLAWSTDDQRLVLQEYRSVNDSSLWILDLSTGKLDLVNPKGKGPIAYGDAEFSLDGKSLYYLSDEKSEFRRLFRYDIATKKSTVIAADPSWDISRFAMSHDGSRLAWTLNRGGQSALFVGPTADLTQAKQLTHLPVGVLGALQFHPTNSELFAFTLDTPRSAGDVYLAREGAEGMTRLTHSEMGGLPPETFVPAELIEFPSFDGRKIPAWVYRPKADKKAPVIISIHGGPEAQVTASFNPTFQFWVNELGAAVIAPNVRGSTGYGKTYSTLDNGFLRLDSVKDIGALLDWIASQPGLDSDRVAVIGGSYGGYMSLASLVEYNGRFRCGVDNVGISHFVTFLEHTEAYRRDLRRAEYGDERNPKMRAFLEKIAPLNHAEQIAVPLLVGQGANDPRVPVSEAEQIVKKVRGSGGEVWYLLAKDEGHGFKKQTNREAYQDTVAMFFERCLLK